MHGEGARRHGSDTEIALAPHGNAHSAYTAKQGQYLAFIYYYTKIHRRSPSEADIQDFFQVSPPAVHQMIMNLAKLGLIGKTPSQGRSIKLLLTRDQLPDLL